MDSKKFKIARLVLLMTLIISVVHLTFGVFKESKPERLHLFEEEQIDHKEIKPRLSYTTSEHFSFGRGPYGSMKYNPSPGYPDDIQLELLEGSTIDMLNVWLGDNIFDVYIDIRAGAYAYYYKTFSIEQGYQYRINTNAYSSDPNGIQGIAKGTSVWNNGVEIWSEYYDIYNKRFDDVYFSGYFTPIYGASIEIRVAEMKATQDVIRFIGSRSIINTVNDRHAVYKWEPNIVCSNITRLEEWYNGIPSSLWLNLTNVGVDSLFADEDFYVTIWPNGSAVDAFDFFIDVPTDIGPDDDFQIEVPFTPPEDGDFWFYVDVDVYDDVKELGEETDTSSDDVRFTSGILDVNEPYVLWESPEENSYIIFDNGTNNWFNFTYDVLGINNITLEIKGYDYGSIWGMNSVNVSYFEHNLEGKVNATLHGYYDDIYIGNDTRSFNFGKIKLYYNTLLEHNHTYLGKQLYLILHDPPGDNSFSGFTEEETDLSIGVDFKFHTDERDEVWGIEITPNFLGFSLGSAGTRMETYESNETTEEFDFRLQVTNTTTLTSNKVSDNPDYIGPGYGDKYWGEAWTIRYDFFEHNRTYWNGTIEHVKYKMNYWVSGEGEAILNHNNAPQEWKALNPVVNGYENVTWIKENLKYNGGSMYSETNREVNTKSYGKTVEWRMSQDMRAKLFITEQELFKISRHTKVYNESLYSHTIEKYFELFDDEPDDKFELDIGLDPIFGTYIFRNNKTFCDSSYPFEYNTTDYVPPEIFEPTIEYDTNDDGDFPCINDNPRITVNIFEEDAMEQVWVRYNYGTVSNYIELEFNQRIGNTFTYSGNMPSIPRGSDVEWYIQAWDKELHLTTKKNIYDELYSYTVINSNPSVNLITPNGGETISGAILIQWESSDADEDSLTYSLAYNLDNTGWHLIADTITELNYLWDTSNIPDTFSVNLRIMVYDEYGGEAIDHCDYAFSIVHADSTEQAISIGYYFLVFFSIGLITIVTITVRKLKSKIS